MSSRTEKDKAKQLQDKCQSVLNSLLRDEDNKYCVDCDSKGPRWASWNIGVFLCIRCAGIHRNLGVHISKVKSVNLDTWTPEQVVSLQQMGNSRARAVYEANLPDNFRRPQSDSALESFIRAKYEHKKYVAREWVPPALPKVDWEREIDEEAERQRQRKKKQATAMVDKKTEGNVLVGAEVVPQLPKPTITARASPKAGRVREAEKKENDLLGLQNGEDSFSGFVSAPVTVKEEKKEVSDLSKNEEESFFNQILPSEKEKVKLDKDSILALYGSAPSINYNKFAQVPCNPTLVQANYSGFVGYPQQQTQPQLQNAFPVQNGMTTVPGQWTQQPQSMQNWTKQGSYTASNQYVANPPSQFSGHTSFVGYPQQLTAGPVFQQNYQSAAYSQTTTSSTSSNMFYPNQNIQQQFSNLTLNNQTANAAGNMWQ